MAKRPKWLENALEEFGEQIVEEELDDAEVASLTGFSPRKVRLLMKELADMEDSDDEEEEEEEEEDVVEEDEEEEEEEEEPAPRRRSDKQGKARGGVKAKAIEEEETPEDTNEDEDDEEEEEDEEPAPKARRGAKAKAAKATKSKKSAKSEDLPDDQLERLRALYRKTVSGETGFVDQLNEEAEARLREVIDMDLDGLLDSVEVIDSGAKWMTVRLNVVPQDLPKGRSSDEKKREKLVRGLLKDIRPALDASDGQAKIFKKNLVIDEDGNGTFDLQIRIR